MATVGCHMDSRRPGATTRPRRAATWASLPLWLNGHWQGTEYRRPKTKIVGQLLRGLLVFGDLKGRKPYSSSSSSSVTVHPEPLVLLLVTWGRSCPAGLSVSSFPPWRPWTPPLARHRLVPSSDRWESHLLHTSLIIATGSPYTPLDAKIRHEGRWVRHVSRTQQRSLLLWLASLCFLHSHIFSWRWSFCICSLPKARYFAGGCYISKALFLSIRWNSLKTNKAEKLFITRKLKEDIICSLSLVYLPTLKRWDQGL